MVGGPVPLTALVLGHVILQQPLSEGEEGARHTNVRGATIAAMLARGVDHKVVPLLWVLRLVVRRVRLREAKHTLRNQAAKTRPCTCE